MKQGNKIILLGGAIALTSMNIYGEKKPRNVVLIIADDFGWNDPGFMGSEYYETPNLDKLAQSGVVFTNGYATCQVSSPSRASILTGKYTTRHGITSWIGEASGEAWRKQGRHNKMLPPDYGHAFKESEVLMPQILKKQGYSTYFVGKWHLGDTPEEWPENKGFDVNIGGWASGSPKGGYFSPYNNPRLKSGPDGENLSMRLANEAVSLMKKHADEGNEKPFFTCLAFYAVHGPIETTQETWGYFRDKAAKTGIAPSAFKVDRTMPVRQVQDNPIYAGLIKQMDDAIGVVLNSLEEMGLDENTMVIFTSDNGGVTSGDNFSTSLLPLRGGKGRQWEGGIRVPFIVKNPIKGQSGVKVDTPVSGIDIFPTIAQFVGSENKSIEKVDGVDITPLINGEQIECRPLFWHYPHYGNQGGEPSSIIRKDDWKLIFYHEDLRYELYNLKIDISESETLNIQYPGKLSELKKELHEWLKETNAIMPQPDMEYDPVAESRVKTRWQTRLIQQKEQERKNILKPDFKPNANWWGSKVTND